MILPRKSLVKNTLISRFGSASVQAFWLGVVDRMAAARKKEMRKLAGWMELSWKGTRKKLHRRHRMPEMTRKVTKGRPTMNRRWK